MAYFLFTVYNKIDSGYGEVAVKAPNSDWAANYLSGYFSGKPVEVVYGRGTTPKYIKRHGVAVIGEGSK